MKASLIQIGNSRGIRIPKVFLEQAGLLDEVEIEVRGSQIVVRPANHPRAGWDEAFAAMAGQRDDRPLDEARATQWEHAEWEW